jgi:hypothetical protein
MHNFSNLFYKVLYMFDWIRTGRSEDRILVGAKFSAPVQTGPGAHPAFCTMGTGSFPGVKSGRGVTLTPHPFLVPWSRRVVLYLYSPYGPYGLYRASVPVQGCTLPFYSTCFGQVHCPLSGVSHSPVDGQWTCPKCVEYFIKYIWEIVHLVGFYYKNISWCTFLWMSNLK